MDIGRARSFLAALEALAVDRIRAACEDEARRVAERTNGQPQRFDGDVAHALVVSEVAVAEGISEYSAARLVKSSEALCGPQLAVLDCLEGGELSEAHARAITEETSTLPEECAEEFGIQALGRLETRSGRKRTAGEFRRAVRSLRERLHPESIRARKMRAAADRTVFVRPEPDGMCTLSALLPAELGLAAFGRLDVLARGHRDAEPDDGRTLAQLRADALAQLVLEGANGSQGHARGASEECGSDNRGPEAGGGDGQNDRPPLIGDPVPSAEIVVVVSAETLLGSSEEPATLEGYGPIDAETARDLAAAAATWQLLSIDGNGVPLALGRTAYRPPKRLRRYIEYRDGTCQFPLCSSPARKAEIDHMVEWQDGGLTDADNLQSLCRKHHALKSLGLWRAQRLEARAGGGAGDILWVSPLGGRAVSGPQERRRDPNDGKTDGLPGERSVKGVGPVPGEGSLLGERFEDSPAGGEVPPPF